MKPLGKSKACSKIGAAVWTGVACVCAFGQADPPPTIESEGVATVYIDPNLVLFRFSYESAGNTAAEAAAKALDFPDAFRTAVKEAAIDTDTLVFSGIGVPDMNQPRAVVTAELSIPLLRFASARDKTIAFAEFCDSVRAVAAKVGAAVDGPILRTDAGQSIEQQAIARATENALYKADAVAAIMKARIYEVEKVIVRDVIWNGPVEDGPPFTPDIARIACSARVTVVYRFAAR